MGRKPRKKWVAETAGGIFEYRGEGNEDGDEGGDEDNVVEVGEADLQAVEEDGEGKAEGELGTEDQ